MRVAITGATGFVGTHLVSALSRQGDEVVPIGRAELRGDSRQLAELLSGCEFVINLAGAPINRRWTPAYKKEIRSSRIDTTRALVSAMARLEERPGTLISASGIGAFDSARRYSEADLPNATDFLGQLSLDWEAAAQEAEALGVRVIIMRFAVVLGRDGGMMKQVLPPFRFGLGGPIGNGRQHFSWVHIDDLVAAILHASDKLQMSGVYHVSAPNPVSNRDFARALGKAVRRPAVLPMPTPMLKLAFGEGADVMTSGQCVVSERLPESGFKFRYPRIDQALSEIVSTASN
jgi:uncharacterized protein (TIGR01777 family)